MNEVDQRETGPERARPSLSDTQENYLKIIYLEVRAYGAARGCGISQTMGVNPSTVAITMRSLRDLGLVDYKPYSTIRLTPLGMEMASRIAGKHDILQRFFLKVLGLGAGQAEAAACCLEHVVTEESVRKFKALEEFLDSHPRIAREWLSLSGKMARERK